MIDSSYKSIVLDLSQSHSISDIIATMDGIVSPSTIYKWLVPKLSYSYSEEEQSREWQRIQNLPGDYQSIPHLNKIVLSNQPHFYDIERELYKKAEIKQKLLDNRLKYIQKSSSQLNSKEILRGFKISGIHVGYSHFSPLWIKKFIEEYKPNYIYDPCGGWGHRMLGAASLNCCYIYNDMWDKTYNGANQIKSKFNLPNIITYNNDCTKFTPTESYDCVFTCPPYFNVESYNDKTFKNLEDYNLWFGKLLQYSIKLDTKYFCYIINHTLLSNTQKICTDNNLTLLNQIKIGRDSVRSHFDRFNNTTRGEFLSIFGKLN